MTMEKTTEAHTKAFIIRNKFGLHARAAAQFVQLANKFDSEIFVEKNGQEVNGKSIMGILMLAASKGVEINVRAEGADSETAVAALGELVDNGFGEEC